MEIKRFLIFVFLFILVLLLGAGSFWLSFKKTISADTSSKDQNIVSKTEAKKDEPLFSFAVFGDTEISGSDNQAPVMQEIIKKINVDKEIIFAIHTGDMTASGTKVQFVRLTELLEGLDISLYATIGNNDIALDRYERNFENYYGRSYYSFNFDDYHFVILDNSSASLGFGWKQREWLKNDLAENKDKRIFLVMHRPINVPLAGVAVEGGNELSKSNIDAFMTIIKPYKEKIQEIFTGHIHTYMEYTLADKIPVVVTGGGGALPQLKAIKQDFHYLKVKVFQDKISIEKISI